MWTLTPKMQEYVHRTGLHHLGDLQKRKIDHSLINALIEQWRPETNTFHFVGGEATITLEDMSFLYALPIDGKALMGPVWSTRTKLEETVLKQLGVKLSTNNANARGHAYLLEVFENFERYAWGPTCLACIYCSLMRATLLKDRLKTITRPLQLMQIWAYSRTTVGHPIRRNLEAVPVKFLLFKMWQNVLSTHSCCTPIQEWQPYRHLILQLKHFVETRDRQQFHTTAPLIYYWIIEQHNVDRVYKQFGLRQPVPPPFHRWERLNEKSLKHNVDYAERCKIYVDAWELRGDIIVIGGPDHRMHCHGEEYLSWYHQASIMSTASSENVGLFLLFGGGSIALMDREQGADVLYELAMRIGQKISTRFVMLGVMLGIPPIQIGGLCIVKFCIFYMCVSCTAWVPRIVLVKM
ncbi:hypothetical protein AAC387_Pa08g1607 [Persea americana]